MGSKYVFKIRRAWVWNKNEGGDGIRRNTNEPIPEKVIQNTELLKRLITERAIELRDIKTNQRVATEYDFIVIPDGDIDFLAKNSGGTKFVEKLSYTNYSPASLQKLRTVIGLNPSYIGKDIVLKAIDDKLASYTVLFKDVIDIEAEFGDKKGKEGMSTKEVISVNRRGRKPKEKTQS